MSSQQSTDLSTPQQISLCHWLRNYNLFLSLIMKAVSILAITLCAFSSQGSCTPVNKPHPTDTSIKSEADIPFKLRSNGFSYRIVDRVTEAKVITSKRALEGLTMEKRADAVHCLGV